MDFYQSVIIIEHSDPLTNFPNSRIMEIPGTNYDSWCNFVTINELRRNLKELWIPQSSGRGEVRLYMYFQLEIIIIITPLFEFWISKFQLEIIIIINQLFEFWISKNLYIYQIFGHPYLKISVLQNHAYPYYPLRISIAILLISKTIDIKDPRIYIFKFVN